MDPQIADECKTFMKIYKEKLRWKISMNYRDSIQIQDLEKDVYLKIKEPHIKKDIKITETYVMERETGGQE